MRVDSYSEYLQWMQLLRHLNFSCWTTDWSEKLWTVTKFLSISFVRQIRLPRKAGEANLPPELLATHLGISTVTIYF